MTKDPRTLSSTLQAHVDACYTHASDLLQAARRSAGVEPLPNIAYHLAALALEEVGKASLIVMGHMGTIREGAEPPWIKKHAANHVKKLFHALWGPTFGRGPITGAQLSNYQELAREIHETRLRGLYVDTSSEAQLPSEVVSFDDAERMIAIAEARLELARSTRLHDFNESEESDLLWFFDATEDPEKLRMIFGSKSFEKLRELGDGRAWMHWVREQFDEAERISLQQVEAELGKPRVEGTDAFTQRWRIRVRFLSDSHTIRPTLLETWNLRVDWIKLSFLNKKDQLGVDIFLPKGVSVAHVYEAGLDTANKLLISLNIGTRGFFWWSLPQHVDRYYDSITDLERNAQLVAERRPALRIDWPGGPLGEKELNEVMLCFAMLPSGDNEAEYEPYLSYRNGIAIIAKSDIHFHAEGSALQQFFMALKQGMRAASVGDFGKSFTDACRDEFGEFFTNAEELQQLLSLGESIEVGPFPGHVTLNEVAMMKALCEIFFLKHLKAQALQRKLTRKKGSTGGNAEET